MKQQLKRALQIVLVPFAAAIVFFEQTLIRYLNRVTAAVAAWPPIARLEAWLKRLPPYWALLTFATPSILILPVKVAAFWFGMHGRYGLALGSVILGKLLGTAILARLYAILRPTLRGLNGVLDRAPRFLDEAHRTLAPLATTIHHYGPAFAFLRPYTPEFVGFTMNWGNAFGTYDSQGHVWDGLVAPGPDAFNEGVAHLPGQVKRPKPNPGDAVRQPWVDATGGGPR